MKTAQKLKFLREACKTTAVDLRCLTTDLALLSNACYEAAELRKIKDLPHGEKYYAMKERIEKLSEELDQRIYAKCEALAMLNCQKLE